MKKHSGTILLVLIFFVGLAVMLYPTISDYINQRNQGCEQLRPTGGRPVRRRLHGLF